VARHLARRAGAGFWRTTLAGACVWVGTEWASPKLFVDTLGHGLYGSPGCGRRRTSAAFTASPSSSDGERMRGIGDRAAAGGPGRFRRADPAGACFAALALGLRGLRRRALPADAIAEHAGTPVTAGVVQADISQYGQLAADLGTFGAVRTILDAHFALSTECYAGAARPAGLAGDRLSDHVRLAEERGRSGLRSRDRTLVAAAGIPLVFGSYDVDA